MKPNLLQAIDRIGDRLAARLDWETMSGLPWGELQPYLVPAPGKLAREVLDPRDPGQRLVVWPRENAMTILESQEIPAHRAPMEVAPEACLLHRPNVTKLAADLAGPIGFISAPERNGDIFHRVGMVQLPNRGTIDVFLLIPKTPGRVKIAAQDLTAARGEKSTMILLPTARWASLLPMFPPTFEVRVLAEFLQTETSDSLIAVASDTATKRKAKARRSVKSLPVRQDDKWSDLTATFNPGNGMLELRIGSRRFSAQVLGSNRSKPRLDAVILELIATSEPPQWCVADLPKGPLKKRNMQKAFERFCERLAEWAPIPDGPPFTLDRSSNIHTPNFTLKRKKS